MEGGERKPIANYETSHVTSYTFNILIRTTLALFNCTSAYKSSKVTVLATSLILT